MNTSMKRDIFNPVCYLGALLEKNVIKFAEVFTFYQSKSSKRNKVSIYITGQSQVLCLQKKNNPNLDGEF